MSIPRILALDMAGNPHKWVDWETACFYYTKSLIGWQIGDTDHRLRGGTSSRTGLQSYLDINTIIAVKGAFVSRIKRYDNPPLSNRILFRRDHNICAYCGHHFPAARLTRDHIIPVSRNGANTWENVVTCCGQCNKVKGDKTPDEAKMPLRFLPYKPNRSEFLILNNKLILPDQMEFLMKRIGVDSRLHGNVDKYLNAKVE